MIEIRHEFEVDGSRKRVWDLVDDIDAFARCVPTLIEHQVQDADRATGIVGVTLGAIPIRSRVDIEVTERRPPERLRGRAVSYLGDTIATQIRKGQPGAVTADAVGRIEIVLDLEEAAAGERTRLRFQCDVDAEGKLEKIYQSIIRLKADGLKAELERNVRAALAAAPTAGSTAEPPAAAAATVGRTRPGRSAPGPSPAREANDEPSLTRWILAAIWRRVYRLLIRFLTR